MLSNFKNDTVTAPPPPLEPLNYSQQPQQQISSEYVKASNNSHITPLVQHQHAHNHNHHHHHHHQQQQQQQNRINKNESATFVGCNQFPNMFTENFASNTPQIQAQMMQSTGKLQCGWHAEDNTNTTTTTANNNNNSMSHQLYSNSNEFKLNQAYAHNNVNPNNVFNPMANNTMLTRGSNQSYNAYIAGHKSSPNKYSNKELSISFFSKELKNKAQKKNNLDIV